MIEAIESNTTPPGVLAPIAIRLDELCTAVPSNHPDALLISACLKVLALQQTLIDISNSTREDLDEGTEAGDAFHRVFKAQRGLMASLGGLYATTPEGITARARVLAMWVREHNSLNLDVIEGDGRCHIERDFVWLMRDVLLMSGVSLPSALERELAA